MPTMKDVAREAGVSLGTVSNVLNNLPSVTIENREKVFEAVRKLNYSPNIAARTLKTNISKSLGLIIPDISNPYYAELARGAEDAARKSGYTVFLCNADRQDCKEREYIRILLEKLVDGIVLIKPSISPDEIISLQNRCRLVVIDAGEDRLQGCEIINVDDYDGAIQAMKLLLDYGHGRIGFIGGHLQCNGSMSRQAGYIDSLESRKLPVEELLLKRGAYDWKSGYTCAKELLEQANRPTAIFAANDLMAIGALKAARDRKLKVPGDLSVIGFDNIDMALLCNPALTTVIRPKYEMGAAAMETIIERIKTGGSSHDKVTILKTELIIRDSAGPQSA